MDSIQLGALKDELLLNKDMLILDFRPCEQFDDGFISGSIYIGGHFSKYHRYLKSFSGQTVYFVPHGDIKDCMTAIQTLGIEVVSKAIKTPEIDALAEAGLLDLIISIDPDELAMDLPFDDKARIIDLRMEHSYQAAHIEGAENIPLEEFMDIGTIAEIEDQENIYLFSNEDDTSFVGSLIKKQGLHNFRKIKGNMEEIAVTERIKITKAPKRSIKED